MRAAFHRKGRSALFGVGALSLKTGRAGISRIRQDHIIDPRVGLDTLEGCCGFGKISQRLMAVGAVGFIIGGLMVAVRTSLQVRVSLVQSYVCNCFFLDLKLRVLMVDPGNKIFGEYRLSFFLKIFKHSFNKMVIFSFI
jgi:hypothetical protein